MKKSSVLLMKYPDVNKCMYAQKYRAVQPCTETPLQILTRMLSWVFLLAGSLSLQPVAILRYPAAAITWYKVSDIFGPIFILGGRLYKTWAQ